MCFSLEHLELFPAVLWGYTHQWTQNITKQFTGTVARGGYVVIHPAGARHF